MIPSEFKSLTRSLSIQYVQSQYWEKFIFFEEGGNLKN